MKGKFLLLGLGLLSTALLIALGVSWLHAGVSGGSPASLNPVGTGGSAPMSNTQTAHEAYTTLSQWLSGWAQDGIVVALSCTFQKEDKSPVGWTFQVYSPTSQQLANVLIEGSDIWVLRELAALYPQQPLALDTWGMDSSAALDTWWAGRGQLLWSQPQAQTLALHLGTRPEGGLTWQVTLLSAEGKVIDFQEIPADATAP